MLAGELAKMSFHGEMKESIFYHPVKRLSEESKQG
jgi:hypothetical protein